MSVTTKKKRQTSAISAADLVFSRVGYVFIATFPLLVRSVFTLESFLA